MSAKGKNLFGRVMTVTRTSTSVPPDIVELTAVFQLLGDCTRLRVVLHILERGECNVTSLCHDLALPQPTVSHHLGLLRDGGLVESRRQGKHIYYNVPHQRTNGRTQRGELYIKLAGRGIHLFSGSFD